TEQKQSGLTLALSGTVGAALNTAVQTARTADESDDGRLKALQGTRAALTAAQAAQAYQMDGAQTGAANARNTASGLKPDDKGYDEGSTSSVGISLSYGSQSSKSETRSESREAQGSTLGAGGNLNITATGAQPGSAGDILVQGSQLQAGGDLGLTAKNDISLLSAQNSERTDSTNSSRGGSAGIGLTAGSGGYGISVSASVNAGKGRANGNGLTHTGTTLTAGNGLSLNAGRDTTLIGLTAGSGGYGISVSASVNAGKGRANGNGLTHTGTTLTAGNGLSLNAGRDTTLTGAQVRGDSVKVDTGRNLTLTSEQDSDRYDSKQQNASAGGSFTFGSMTGSASVNLSQDKMHSNWQSVAEQTGIFAGKGGFDVTAGEHTQLNGAVISSTASADKNRLDTGTLGFSNIENHADYKTEHQSVGMSTGGSIGSQFGGNMANGLSADKNRLDTGTLGFSNIENHADYKTEHQSVGMSTGGSIGSQFGGNMANGLLAGLNGSGSASSVTESAVSDGTIVIRDKAKQTQDVSALSRDAEGANPGLDKIFDKDKEQRR
ncbi:hypothetical protein F3I58_18565, partial [Pantoea sp. VH_4]